MLDDPFDATPTMPLTVENREARLMQFVMWVLKHSWKGGSLDGGEMQDKAHLLGILQCVPFDPLLHTDVEGNAGPGDDWYVYTQPLDKFTKINWQVPPAVTAKATQKPTQSPFDGMTPEAFLTGAEKIMAATKEQLDALTNQIMSEMPFDPALGDTHRYERKPTTVLVKPKPKKHYLIVLDTQHQINEMISVNYDWNKRFSQKQLQKLRTMVLCCNNSILMNVKGLDPETPWVDLRHNHDVDLDAWRLLSDRYWHFDDVTSVIEHFVKEGIL